METEKHGLYIPPEAWHSQIPNSAKILYGRLCTLPSFSVDGSFASREWMASEIGVSKQRITQLIRVLIDAELILDNGWHIGKNRQKTRILKRNSLEITNRKLMDNDTATGNNKLLGVMTGNKKLLGGCNNKLLGVKEENDKKVEENQEVIGESGRSNNKSINNKSIYSFASPDGEGQRDINPSLPSYYQNRNGVRPHIIRFTKSIQKEIIKNHPDKFRQYSSEQIDNKIKDGSSVIDKLIRINNFDFQTEIKPCLHWAINDDFWTDQIRSLVPLRNKSSNGEMKFTNIFDSWKSDLKKKKKKRNDDNQPPTIGKPWTVEEINRYNEEQDKILKIEREEKLKKIAKMSYGEIVRHNQSCRRGHKITEYEMKEAEKYGYSG